MINRRVLLASLLLAPAGAAHAGIYLQDEFTSLNAESFESLAYDSSSLNGGTVVGQHVEWDKTANISIFGGIARITTSLDNSGVYGGINSIQTFVGTQYSSIAKDDNDLVQTGLADLSTFKPSDGNVGLSLSQTNGVVGSDLAASAPLTITFNTATATKAFGGFFNSEGTSSGSVVTPNNFSFTVYDTSGTLVGTQVFTKSLTSSGALLWAGIASDSNIGKVEIRGFIPVMDDLRYGVAATPEPVSTVLGLSAVGVFLRRRRK